MEHGKIPYAHEHKNLRKPTLIRKGEMKLIFAELIFGVFALESNPDGSGGNAPDILQYVMLNADVTYKYTGFDPHAVHGIVTQDDGYIASGFSLYSEGNPK